jgi:hypothetical protein
MLGSESLICDARNVATRVLEPDHFAPDARQNVDTAVEINMCFVLPICLSLVRQVDLRPATSRVSPMSNSSALRYIQRFTRLGTNSVLGKRSTCEY